jgi:hypothetical protein
LRAARLFHTATSFSAWDPIAAKLALAPFVFGPLGCGLLARQSAFVEAHGPKSPGHPPIYDGPGRSHNAKFSSAFLRKSRPAMLNLSLSVDDPLLPSVVQIFCAAKSPIR